MFEPIGIDDMTLQYLYSFSVLDWCMLGALALVFMYQLYFYIRYMAGVQRRVRHQQKQRFRWNPKRQERQARKAREAAEKAAREAGLELAPEQPEKQEQPGVSIVVCAKNEGENLQNYLTALLCQNYPKFEVIVVNDASEDNTQFVLDHYLQLYKNLHLTFVPSDAMVSSSKKLALTLAAKAAKYDYLLLTDADCRPESTEWITEMMKGFCKPETEVVIGYGGYFEEQTAVNTRIQYDTIFNAMQYLGMAMSRHPYMGVGRNLAYKKETFFKNRGFAGLLSKRAGDDDLFVNKVCTPRNTEVVLTPMSYTWSIPKRTFREWRVQKARHLSVAPDYKFITKLRLVLEPFSRGLWYALLIAVGVLAGLGLISPLVALAAALLFISRLTWQIIMMSRAASIFMVKGFGLEVLWFDIWLPVIDLFMLIRQSFRKNINW